MSLFSIDEEQLALAKTLVQTCKKYNFDGFVIEIWLNFGGKIKPEKISKLVQRLGRSRKLLF